MAKNHGRTLNAEEYDSYKTTFGQESGPLIANNWSDEVLKAKLFLDNRKRSHWATIPNSILALVDAITLAHFDKANEDFEKKEQERKRLAAFLKDFCDETVANTLLEQFDFDFTAWKELTLSKLKGVPILVIGIPTFQSSMKGKRSSCPKAIIEYLKRFFPVVMINEFNTSKLCPCCHEYLVHKQGTKGTRVWECKHGCKSPKHPEKSLIVNKDVSAALNIFTIFITLLSTGKRPSAFAPKKSKNAIGKV